jgi:hypothetical protein
MWRCRNSAAANRRALHSDYTSATKKTLTPLNGTCTRRRFSFVARLARCAPSAFAHDGHAQ